MNLKITVVMIMLIAIIGASYLLDLALQSDSPPPRQPS